MTRAADLRARLAALRPWRSQRDRSGATTGPIGFELGDESLHLVQFDLEARGLRPRTAEVELPADRESCLADAAVLRPAVREAMARGGFRGRSVVGAFSPPDVKLMALDFRSNGADSDPQTIVRLVGERFDEKPDELVIDYMPIRALGDSGSDQSALVAVAKRELVFERLELFRAVGWNVDALEITPMATRRLVTSLPQSDPEENSVALFAGRRAGHLLVMWGRRLLLHREIPFGDETARAQLSKALELSAAEADALLCRHGVALPEQPDPALPEPASSNEIAATSLEILKPSFYELAEQIDRARTYVASKARGVRPDRVYLLGAFARWPGADGLLERLAGGRVSCLDPIGSDPAARTGPPSPERTLAAGLAMRGLRDDG